MNGLCSNQLNPIYKGDDAVITLEVVQPDGSNMNFNGKTVKFIVKKNKASDDTTAIVSKTYTPTEDIEKLSIHLTKSDTDKDPGLYWWGIRVISEDYQTTEGEGKVEIKQGPFYAE